MSLDIPPIVHRWLLRLLVPLGGHRQFITQHGFTNDTLAEQLGLGEWIDPEQCEFDQKLVRSALRQLHQSSKQGLDVATPNYLSGNLARLSKLVGLSETDCRILEFVVLIQSEQLLDDTADCLGHLSSAKVFHALSVLLDLPEPEIRSALCAQGILAKSGLVSVDRNGNSMLRGKLELLSDNFADNISSAEADPVSLLRDTVALSSPAALEMSDYGHLTASLSVLRPYLKQSIASGRKGVNVFFYGDPGTGKSQLAKVLAKELDCDLFEVASENEDGDPVKGVRSIREQLGADAAACAVEHLIGNTLEAQGHRPIRKNDPNRLPEIYAPVFIQADTNLAQVAARLLQSKSGRLCLYGQAKQAVRGCDLLISIGTSAAVFPAAELPFEAAERGATVIQVNPAETPLDEIAKYNLLGSAGVLMDWLVVSHDERRG